jgi:hypothetical protein
VQARAPAPPPPHRRAAVGAVQRALPAAASSGSPPPPANTAPAPSGGATPPSGTVATPPADGKAELPADAKTKRLNADQLVADIKRECAACVAALATVPEFFTGTYPYNTSPDGSKGRDYVSPTEVSEADFWAAGKKLTLMGLSVHQAASASLRAAGVWDFILENAESIKKLLDIGDAAKVDAFQKSRGMKVKLNYHIKVAK